MEGLEIMNMIVCKSGILLPIRTKKRRMPVKHILMQVDMVKFQTIVLMR